MNGPDSAVGFEYSGLQMVGATGAIVGEALEPEVGEGRLKRKSDVFLLAAAAGFRVIGAST